MLSTNFAMGMAGIYKFAHFASTTLHRLTAPIIRLRRNARSLGDTYLLLLGGRPSLWFEGEDFQEGACQKP